MRENNALFPDVSRAILLHFPAGFGSLLPRSFLDFCDQRLIILLEWAAARLRSKTDGVFPRKAGLLAQGTDELIAATKFTSVA